MLRSDTVPEATAYQQAHGTAIDRRVTDLRRRIGPSSSAMESHLEIDIHSGPRYAAPAEASMNYRWFNVTRI